MAKVAEYQLVEEVILNAGEITWGIIEQKRADGSFNVNLVDNTGLATIMDSRSMNLKPVRLEAVVDGKQIVDLSDVLFNKLSQIESLNTTPESMPAINVHIPIQGVYDGLKNLPGLLDSTQVQLRFKVRVMYSDEVMPYVLGQLGMAHGIDQLVEAQNTIDHLSQYDGDDVDSNTIGLNDDQAGK